MFKKKENKLPYFFGSTAIGMAAGLLVGKLLLNTPAAESQNIELKPSSNERVIKYSSEDNIQNLHLHKNINSCTCSESMSPYENKSCKEESASKVSFIKLDNNFKDNINDVTSDKKYSPNFSKIVFDDVNQLHNISVEDNVGYNTTDEIFLDPKEDKVCNIDPSEFENMRHEILADAKSVRTDLISIEDSNISGTINIKNISSNKRKILKRSKRCTSIELAEMINNSSNDLLINDTTGYDNLQKVDNSAMNLNILKSSTENDINLVTYNSMLQSDGDKKDETLYCTTSDDFNETHLISSTKVNDSDYM
ncbi:uncharacterized protein LOC128886418 isoform X1 [Hylaeus anthracinus]|uniref:uncharacterized protein LOC128886418 isoform X1 n=1 Tax=Hylaeus anthracinus TaxID=313031 RepID=UPI0023B9B79C|nr:uncharacterized protein LOC128886418 isoform X1 [Hylaeus anthracinus]